MKIYIDQQWQQIIKRYKKPIDTTNFQLACSYFRKICKEIRALIGDKTFKGSYNDIMNFYNHNTYKTDKGMQLAIALNGCTKLCKYEAKKLGITNWLDRCWQLEPQKNILYYNLQVETNKDFIYNGKSVDGNIEKGQIIQKANTPIIYYWQNSSFEGRWWSEKGVEIRYNENNLTFFVNYISYKNIQVVYDPTIVIVATIDGITFTITPIPVYQE